MMKKLAESTIVTSMVVSMHAKGCNWTPMLSEISMKCFVASVTDFLRLVKRPENKAVALVVNDSQEEPLFAGIVRYHEGADASDPGNFTYEFTFDKADLANVKLYTYNDIQFQKVMVTTSYQLCGMEFVEQCQIINIIDSIVETLILWADSNSKEGEESTVELENFFSISVKNDAGRKVVKMEPIGTMKTAIKDDAKLQA